MKSIELLDKIIEVLGEKEAKQYKQELINLLKKGLDEEECFKFVVWLEHEVVHWCKIKDKLEKMVSEFKDKYEEFYFCARNSNFSDLVKQYCDFRYLRERSKLLNDRLSERNIDKECVKILDEMFSVIEELRKYYDLVSNALLILRWRCLARLL